MKDKMRYICLRFFVVRVLHSYGFCLLGALKTMHRFFKETCIIDATEQIIHSFAEEK